MFFETIITFLKKYVKGKNGLPFPFRPAARLSPFRLFAYKGMKNRSTLFIRMNQNQEFT